MILLSVIQHVSPPVWLVFPFVLLLLSIAIGPLFFSHFWHKRYKAISLIIGLLIGAYYLFFLNQTFVVAETLAEYVSFISLLFALYVAAGGIYIFVDIESKAITNVLFLLIGAILTNIIGTTGASVLLIRPFMRLNRYRLKAYHIVFFIFFVSNLGGLLTPIGDPPLFMGFLKGVPFFWTLQNLFPEWITALFLLVTVFLFLEKKNTQLDDVDVSQHYTNKIIINGKRNFIWLALITGTVFLDPNVIEGFPCIVYHGKKISFIREVLQLAIAFVCLRHANKHAMQNNKFDFEPIKEVAFLFFGIFLSMIPALQLLEVAGSFGGFHLSEGTIYFSSGLFSAVLDNAPTYVNFLALVMAMFGWSISNLDDVNAFLASEHIRYLVAVSVGSVFFGAMTYIGNGPNFMVKSIAESSGVKMPSFFEYIFKFTFPYLLPILILIWLIFFL
jgi:Na+/H+ antiporter NhaD/arsenite permease-like protein